VKLKNNTGKIVATAGLVIALAVGFVIIPRAISNTPESSEIETISFDPGVLTETGAEVPTDSDAGGLTESGPDKATESDVYSLLDNEGANFFLANFSRDEMIKNYPDLKIITREQAIAGALEGLRSYGYEPEPMEFDIIARFVNYMGEIDVPYCSVSFRYDYKIDREIDIQEYLDSEQFKGMSEAEIREIIECDDLSQIPYKPKKEHPKFKILDNESYTAYYYVEVNAQTGEFIKATETRVRYGEFMDSNEAHYFGKPIGNPDLYYPGKYY